MGAMAGTVRLRADRDAMLDPAFTGGLKRKRDGVELLHEGVQLLSCHQARLAAQDTEDSR